MNNYFMFLQNKISIVRTVDKSEINSFCSYAALLLFSGL